MRKINDVIIMAAGRGSRMMPLTNDIPKPMAPIWGSTIIANGINNLQKEGLNIHVTVGYKGALLAEHVITLGVSSILDTSGRGNSWWIYNSLLKNYNGPIFVLTCDNLVELDFQALEEEYYSFGEPACMVVPVVPVPELKGDFIFQENNVVVKLDRNEPSDYYCSVVQIINPFKVMQITSEVEDFYEVWNQLIQKKQLYASNILPKKWFAIDTVDQLKIIEREPKWK